MSASSVELGLGEVREEVLADDGQVRHARFLQALAPGVGEAGVGAAGVVFAGAALEQRLALEPVDQAREPAARELRLLGEVAHPHPPAAAPRRGGCSTS